MTSSHVPVKQYSSGMYMRLAFAIATEVNPDIFLIDEILAVGDGEFRRKCFERIEQFRTRGKTILFVSHDLTAISYRSSPRISGSRERGQENVVRRESAMP